MSHEERSRSHSATDMVLTPTDSSHEDLIGDRAQAIIAVNQKLKELGVDQTISLPQIVVIGDQSVGKSSLIEALSNIQVPKAEGTCTRCPIAINLNSGTEPDSPWTCKISIEERYDYDPTQTQKITMENPLGPWQKRVNMKKHELSTTQDKSMIPALVADAQNKVLSMAAHSVNKTRSGKLTSVKFSPNIVRLDISEGIRPNLCFIDLPGVISSVASSQDQYLVQLVRNLVREYAQDERNENILTLPMNRDVQTSNTCSLVQELNAEQRTLAVFTKADRATREERELFINNYLLKAQTSNDSSDDGEKLRFQNGCHFVMLENSSSGQLLGAEKESRFFNSGPWQELQPDFKHRIGVPALSNYLREQLFQKTCEALPDTLEAVQKELQRIEDQLRALPPPPDKMFFCLELQQVLEIFVKAMESKFLDDGEKSVRGALRMKCEAFAERTIDASPVVDHATVGEKKAMKEVLEELEDSCKDNKRVSILPPDDDGTADHTTGKHFRLTGLRIINQTFQDSGLPGEVDPRAVTKACREATDCWMNMVDQFFKEIQGFLNEHVKKVFNAVFTKYQNLGIYPMVENWLNDYLKQEIQAEQQIAATNCHAERRTPFTLNHHAMDILNAKKRNSLYEKRLAYRIGLAKKEKDLEEGKPKENRKDVTGDTIGRDDFKAEVILGSRVQAYYELASHRFVDVICQGMHARLLPICGRNLAEALKVHIGIRDSKNEDQITAWMVEDAKKEEERQRLTHKRAQLLEGRRYIESVLTPTTDSSQISPSKRAYSPTLNGAEDPQTPSKKAKIAHRPASRAPVTPRTRLSQSMEHVQLFNAQ